MKCVPEVVRVCLVSPDANALLVTRGPGDNRSGQNEFFGGNKDPEDADWIATAVREAKEEAHYPLDPDCLVNADEPFIIPKINRRNKVVKKRIFFLGFAEDESEVEPGPEQSAAFWTPFDGLPDLLSHEAQLQAGDFFASKPELQLFLGKGATIRAGHGT